MNRDRSHPSIEEDLGYMLYLTWEEAYRLMRKVINACPAIAKGVFRYKEQTSLLSQPPFRRAGSAIRIALRRQHPTLRRVKRVVDMTIHIRAVKIPLTIWSPLCPLRYKT